MNNFAFRVIKTSTGQMINFVDIFLLNEHNSVELLIVGSHYEIFRYVNKIVLLFLLATFPCFEDFFSIEFTVWT